jgi:hypothetical protein
MGTITDAVCAADGTTQLCPDGSKVIAGGGACVPDGLTSCAETDGQACSIPGQECHTGGPCGCICYCVETANTLKWGCSCLLC